MATLRLMRPDENANRMAEMIVYLNGSPLGTIMNNESKYFDVPEGKHALKARIDSQGSKTFKFTVPADGTKALVISTDNEANSSQPLLSGTMLDFVLAGIRLVYYFTIGHNRYLTITELKMQ